MVLIFLNRKINLEKKNQNLEKNNAMLEGIVRDLRNKLKTEERKNSNLQRQLNNSQKTNQADDPMGTY